MYSSRIVASTFILCQTFYRRTGLPLSVECMTLVKCSDANIKICNFSTFCVFVKTGARAILLFYFRSSPPRLFHEIWWEKCRQSSQIVARTKIPCCSESWPAQVEHLNILNESLSSLKCWNLISRLRRPCCIMMHFRYPHWKEIAVRLLKKEKRRRSSERYFTRILLAPSPFLNSFDV